MKTKPTSALEAIYGLTSTSAKPLAILYKTKCLRGPQKTDIWGELDIQCRPDLRWPCEYPLDSSLLSLDRCRVLFYCRYHYHSRFVFDEGGYKWNRNQMTKCRFSKAIGCKSTMGIWSSWWVEVPSNCLTSGGMTLLELNSLHKAMH